MVHNFQAGDFLVFQLESGYGLLRVLAVEETGSDTVWHIAAYRDLFFDIDAVDAALDSPGSLTLDRPHLALTNRAFESTQVARMRSIPLSPAEIEQLESRKRSGESAVSDRSIRLHLGLR